MFCALFSQEAAEALCRRAAQHFAGGELEEAVKCYREAAAQGNAGAQYNLGVCYKNGEGVKRDMEEACLLYTSDAADE